MGMEQVYLFPFAEYWWFYAAFIGFVMLMLALDLGVFHKEAHAVTFKESASWSVIWISLALLFNFLFYLYAYWKFHHDPRLLALPGFEPALAAKQVGLEFLTGFVIEKSLAIDNIFVFVVVFGFFAIPPKYQHRVLFFGIIGALIFRAIFIALGSILMQYEAVVIAFGIFLILTGIKMVFQEEKKLNPGDNFVIKFLKKIIPITPELHGQKLFIRQNGILFATPLFVALIFVELTDIIFAVDSVPAIFAITKEPLIVFTSNIFAILGLRALYFMLAGVVDKFHLLHYGLAGVLVFVGAKMVYLNHLFEGKFPISLSLAVILVLIGGSVIASLLIPKKESSQEAK
jgi:tellurite resistance protein TerC